MTSDEMHPATPALEDLIEHIEDKDGADVVGDIDVHPDGESWLVTMRVELEPDVTQVFGDPSSADH